MRLKLSEIEYAELRQLQRNKVGVGLAPTLSCGARRKLAHTPITKYPCVLALSACPQGYLH